MVEDRRRLSEVASELTGELPRFVRDALGRPQQAPADAAEPAFSEDDRRTIQALVDLGVDRDEAAAAVREDRVPLVLAQRVISDRPRWPLAVIAERSGVPADLLAEIRIATGLPLPERFGRRDLAWARLLAQVLEVLPADAVVRAARARGAALSAVARTDLEVVREQLLLPMRQAGADDITVAVTLAETTRSFEELARQLLELTYRSHLEHHLNSELVASITRSGVESVHLAVGFVDVVGWTSLSSRIDPEGLDTVLDAFESRVIEVTAPDPDVSLVKYLGDAVMLVSADATTLARALLELTREVPELEDAPLRAGLAAGSTLLREGDYFGPSVNLAARLTDLARPWSVLAAEELVDELSDSFEVRRIRPTRIRGVGLRRPLAVTAPAED